MNFAWSIGPAPLVQQVVWKRGFEMSADLFPKDGLPSSEDLDALAAEQRIAEETATAGAKRRAYWHLCRELTASIKRVRAEQASRRISNSQIPTLVLSVVPSGHLWSILSSMNLARSNRRLHGREYRCRQKQRVLSFFGHLGVLPLLRFVGRGGIPILQRRAGASS